MNLILMMRQLPLAPIWGNKLLVVMDFTIFSWNCQGAASPRFCRALASFIQGYKPEIIVLVEPRISGSQADHAIRKIGYAHSHRVESQGFSGGIWILWKPSVTVEALFNHRQFIHVKITSVATNKSCFYTAVYGSPHPMVREDLWHCLSQVHRNPTQPWVLSGDFNATVAPEERCGGMHRSNSGNKSFKHFLLRTGLIDLGYSGPKFTWQRGNLMVRLDRAIANSSWVSQHPDAIVCHLPRIKSDHRPILLRSSSATSHPQSSFKFLASWLLHPGFDELVGNSWDTSRDLVANIETFTDQAQAWNKTIFGHIGQQKRKLHRRLLGIQRALERPNPPASLLALEKQLQAEHETMCLKEEVLWMQNPEVSGLMMGIAIRNTTTLRPCFDGDAAESLCLKMMRDLGRLINPLCTPWFLIISKSYTS